jgi:hypothetical protein
MMRTQCPAYSRAVVVYPTWVGTTTECPHCRGQFVFVSRCPVELGDELCPRKVL